MRLLRSLILSSLILLVILRATANDTMVTLGAGGLIPVQSPEIAMDSEDLQISVHQITVKYVFRNSSNHDIEARIAFPLPPLDGAEVENSPIALPSKDPVNYMSFRVTVDGQAVSPEAEIRAFKNGQDITSRLRSLGLPLSVLSPEMKSAIDKLSPEQLKQLVKDDWIAEEEIERAAGKKERWVWPCWESRIQFHWTQHFPANRSVEVLHSYQPVVGGSFIVMGNDGKSSVRPFCGNSETLGQIEELQARLPGESGKDIALRERRIQYVLTTGSNWSGPIRDFHLMVVTDQAKDILATCMPGLRRVSPTQYEVTHTNFHPESEPDLLVLQASK